MRIICHLDNLLNERNWDVRTLSKMTGIRENTLGEMRRNENKTFSRENVIGIMMAMELTDLGQLMSVEME